MKRQPWQLTEAEKEQNSVRVDAEIAAASARLVVFNEGYQAGLEHWPPCANPYLGIDKDNARAWSQGRAAAAPNSAYARMVAERERQERDWQAFLFRQKQKAKENKK